MERERDWGQEGGRGRELLIVFTFDPQFPKNTTVIVPLLMLCLSICLSVSLSLIFLLALAYLSIYLEDVPLVEFMYLVFTRMPCESYRRRLIGSLLSYLCYVF